MSCTVGCAPQIEWTSTNYEAKSKQKKKIVFPKDSKLSVKVALSPLIEKYLKHKTKPLIVFKFELSTNQGRQLFGIFDSLNHPTRPTEICFTHIWSVSGKLDESQSLSYRVKLSDIKDIENSKVHAVACRWLNKKKPTNKPWLVTLESTSGESKTGLLTIVQGMERNLIPSISLRSDPDELSTISTTTIDKIASLKRVQLKTALNAYRSTPKYSDTSKILRLIQGFPETTASWGKAFDQNVFD